jgi:hypothetical protein
MASGFRRPAASHRREIRETLQIGLRRFPILLNGREQADEPNCTSRKTFGIGLCGRCLWSLPEKPTMSVTKAVAAKGRPGSDVPSEMETATDPIDVKHLITRRRERRLSLLSRQLKIPSNALPRSSTLGDGMVHGAEL